jgi:hypothetical protein
MPLQFNIQSGSVTPYPATLTDGCHFEWTNPSGNPVKLTGCGGFCTESEYDVPAAVGGTPGTQAAIILQNPTGPYTFTETPNAWQAPGNPRIVVNPEPSNKAEVA